jgi:hypothetical protein
MCHLFPKSIWAGVLSFHYPSESVPVGAPSVYVSSHLRQSNSDESRMACELCIEQKIQFGTEFYPNHLPQTFCQGWRIWTEYDTKYLENL